MLSYRAILDVPFQLVVFVSELLAGHRRNRHRQRRGDSTLLHRAGALKQQIRT